MRESGARDLLNQLRVLQEEIERFLEMEKRLKDGETRMNQIIQGTSIPTFVIDSQHRITHWNRACENLTKLPASMVIGTSNQWMSFYGAPRPVMADLLVDDVPQSKFQKFYGDKFQKSRVIPGAYEAEDFFPDLGENGKYLFFTAAPIKNSDGVIIGAIETLQDITQRKLAEKAILESGKKYRKLLDLAPYPIAVFDSSGRVSYLNPAFTSVFGWSIEEMTGDRIPFVPENLREETRIKFHNLLKEKFLLRYETKRLAKDGRILDVVMRAVVYSESPDKNDEILLIIRDITREKRIARNNRAILRISTALPEYPELGELLDYISAEVQRLLGSEGALIGLLDEEKDELYFPGVHYQNATTSKRLKGIRFTLDEVVAGEVIRTGQPVIVNNADKTDDFPGRDEKLGYKTRNMAEVPLRSGDRIIGVLAALNKIGENFDEMDLDLLSMISGTVALSIENAWFSEDVKKAYREVSSMNRAKEKAINHLSHELKTPVSVLSGSLNILSRKFAPEKNEAWKKTMDRAVRNLSRIVEIQYEVNDIMQGLPDRRKVILSGLIDQCADILESVAVEESGDFQLGDRIRKRIDELFENKSEEFRQIHMEEFIKNRLESSKPLFSHRKLRIDLLSESDSVITMPISILEKIVDGMLRNAVENTPDGGRIEIRTGVHGENPELSIMDYGVGITDDARGRIFDGFFTTRDTQSYSSKKPYDFNAGGKGADLLRIRIFSERYHFRFRMQSQRCRHIPLESDICPGDIKNCPFCKTPKDCEDTGGSTFSITFSRSRITDNTV